MSRSRKKHPWVKIGDKSLKKLYNRRLRRRKQLDYPSGNKYRREPGNSSWDICEITFWGYEALEDEPRRYWCFMK